MIFGKTLLDTTFAWQKMGFYWFITEVCSQWPNWQEVSIDAGNGLALYRHQAITLTNTDHYMALLGHNKIRFWDFVTNLWVTLVNIMPADDLPPSGAKSSSHLMAWCNTSITPVHLQWSYCSLAQSHWYDINNFAIIPCYFTSRV